ncbi:MAG: sulfatase-like hydrolase/transferase [Janthinobacterium lividum]
MRRFAASGAIAFALANLYLLFLTGPLVSPQHQLIFHLPGSAMALFVPVIIDLLVLWLMLAILLFWAQRHPRAEVLVWATLLFPLPWVLLETVASFAGQPANRGLLWLSAFIFVGGWLLVAFRGREALPAFRRLRRAVATVLSFVAISGAVILLQLLWLGWKARDLNRPFQQRVASAGARSDGVGQPAGPRVVWIILDELSYAQVYGHRFAGLALPNFDRLASEATVFREVKPAAQYTRIAMPSLLTGKSVNATAPTSDGQNLMLHLRGQKGWQPLQPQDTVFGDAVRAGLPTAVAGWYEPYCRILPRMLDECFWTYSDNMPGGLSGEASIATNAVAPLRETAGEILAHSGTADDAADVRRHEADYHGLSRAGDQLLESQKTGLLVLHMPIPHPWGFYDRHTNTFPGHRTSYLDNLALADTYLGHVRAVLEANGGWDNTDVLIMGDHGWRTHAVWRQSGFWTAEEAAASHGDAAEDPPAVILKLHAQHEPARIGSPFDAVRTRTLIDALLVRQIATAAELQQWVAHLPAS